MFLSAVVSWTNTHNHPCVVICLFYVWMVNLISLVVLMVRFNKKYHNDPTSDWQCFMHSFLQKFHSTPFATPQICHCCLYFYPSLSQKGEGREKGRVRHGTELQQTRVLLTVGSSLRDVIWPIYLHIIIPYPAGPPIRTHTERHP